MGGSLFFFFTQPLAVRVSTYACMFLSPKTLRLVWVGEERGYLFINVLCGELGVGFVVCVL